MERHEPIQLGDEIIVEGAETVLMSYRNGTWKKCKIGSSGNNVKRNTKKEHNKNSKQRAKVFSSAYSCVFPKCGAKFSATEAVPALFGRKVSYCVIKFSKFHCEGCPFDSSNGTNDAYTNNTNESITINLPSKVSVDNLNETQNTELSIVSTSNQALKITSRQSLH